MPGVCRQGLTHVKSMLDPVVESGLKSILIFGVINKLPKVNKSPNFNLIDPLIFINCLTLIGSIRNSC